MQLIWNLSIEGMMGAQYRFYLHGVHKVSIFTHRNKLTSRIVSMSQTSFGHISTNSSTIPTVLKPA